jgi:DnaA family protein
MTPATGQITLPFARYERIDFDLYLTTANQETVASLQRTAAGTDARNHYLWGSSGSGKSHLLQAACTRVSARGRTAAYLPLRQHRQLAPAMLSGLAQYDLVCVDDLDSIQGEPEWEQSIFILFNEMREQIKPVLFSAALSPHGIGIVMPDLKSRLAWDLVFHLAPIDDASLLTALQRRARARMFDLPDEVVEYLVKRVPRDTHSLFKLLDRLDAASLQSQKRLTIPFVKSVLDLE